MMHEASKPTPSFAMPTTVGFGFSARRWRSVLALWTLIVEVAGSILGTSPSINDVVQACECMHVKLPQHTLSGWYLNQMPRATNAPRFDL